MYLLGFGLRRWRNGKLGPHHRPNECSAPGPEEGRPSRHEAGRYNAEPRSRAYVVREYHYDGMVELSISQ